MTLSNKTHLRIQAGLLICVAAAACRASDNSQGLPPTRTAPVVDTYHGVQVVDDYRWLEDWNNGQVREWSDAQNAYARNILDQLESRDAIRARVSELRSDQGESYFGLSWRAGRLFALKRQPPKQQPFVISMESADDAASAKTLLDPTAIDASGSTSIDFYEPSRDGALVAVSLSKDGSESGDVHIYDASGKEQYEVVTRVNGGTAGGDVAWTADGSGFFYTRYPHPGERPAEDLFFYQQVYFHTLGSNPKNDRYEFGEGLPRVAEIRVDAHPTESYLLASVQLGDGGGIEHFLRFPDGTWQKLATVTDRVSKVQFGPQRDLFLVSTKGAPHGKLLRLPLANPRLGIAQTIVPEGDGVIHSDFWEAGPNPIVVNSRLFVPYVVGGPMSLKSFGLDGTLQAAPQLLPISAVSEMTRVGDDLMFLNVSFTTSPAWYRFSPADGKTQRTSLMSGIPLSFDDAEVIRKSAVSLDGTTVPYVVIRPAGSPTNLPTLVSGYGGYGVSRTPFFNPLNRLVLDQGFAIVDTVLRGGGEFGDTWHEDGKLARKQHVFDDFAAVLKRLIDDGDASPERLAIIGGSNGGLLMGATFTQHPELMRVAISSVGIYDMLRVELSPNGAFNVPEFGTVKDRGLFTALHAYSPYHRVRAGQPYPAILFLTGANDPRVDPMQSRKMTARLQASGTRRAVLLRTSGNTGHGIGTPLDARIEQDTDIYSFLFHELGVKFQAGLVH